MYFIPPKKGAGSSPPWSKPEDSGSKTAARRGKPAGKGAKPAEKKAKPAGAAAEAEPKAAAPAPGAAAPSAEADAATEATATGAAPQAATTAPGADAPVTTEVAATADEATGEKHVATGELRSIGGDPMPEQAIRLRDPDSKKVVAELETDKSAHFSAIVPEAKSYLVEIVAEPASELPSEEQSSPDEHALLVCRFEDASGKPARKEAVTITAGGDTSTHETDDDGALTLPLAEGPCVVKLRGHAFKAHTVAPEEQLASGWNYVFVLDAKAGEAA